MRYLIVLIATSAFLARGATIENARYADDAAARAAWVPMAGTAPVGLGTIEGEKVLRFPCNLAGTGSERASWDRKVALDLSTARGVQFKLWCQDPSHISYFSLTSRAATGGTTAHSIPKSPTAGTLSPSTSRP